MRVTAICYQLHHIKKLETKKVRNLKKTREELGVQETVVEKVLKTETPVVWTSGADGRGNYQWQLYMDTRKERESEGGREKSGWTMSGKT